MTTEKLQTPQVSSPQKPAPALRVRWDDASAKTSHPTMCNVSSTRDEITLSFGLNQAWKVGQGEILVQLTDRIILSPQSAKSLALLLIKALREYNARSRPVPAPGA